jgi:predicted dehydrogenase/threonine dehydrogenase-like Zn-dependent dehydrogenase
LGKARQRPDLVQKVLDTARRQGLLATYRMVSNRLDALTPLGYSSAGIVLEVGETCPDFRPGDRVACAGGDYAYHAEVVFVPHNLVIPVPSGVKLDAAAFATVGAIALQGVRQAEVRLGEVAVVIGLGLVGQLAMQLLKSAGCRVLGVDLDSARASLAQRLGADMALLRDHDLVGALRTLSPLGADAVLITAATKSNDPVELAASLCRDRGTVVVVGDIRMDLPRQPFYEKELTLRLSRSYGPGRYDPTYEEKGIDYPIGYVRWTEKRNMAAFLDLVTQGQMDVEPLITHRFPLEAAPQAYDLVSGQAKEPFLGILFEYAAASADAPVNSGPVFVRKQEKPLTDGDVGIGLVGAGNFAQNVLLPHLRGRKGVRLRGIVSAGGLSARSVAERFGFEYCARDMATLLADEAVHLVLIATRHDSHATLAIQALDAGRAVFVEKPLALNREELEAVAQAAINGFLMVGFNRRFAPFVQKLRAFFSDCSEPPMVTYRINADSVPRDHWIQDPEVGGGRIRGEVCHFVDLIQYLVGSQPRSVYAQALPDGGIYNKDNLSATICFENEAIGVVTYVANGDRSLPKEYIEVFGGGRTAGLDDFRSLRLAANGRTRMERIRWRQDKGHRGELDATLRALRNGDPPPIPLMESIAATLATFAIEESLSTGKAIVLSSPESLLL